jgi:hypothetical protein
MQNALKTKFIKYEHIETHSNKNKNIVRFNL